MLSPRVVDADNLPLVTPPHHAPPSSPVRASGVTAGSKLSREALQLQRDKEKFEEQQKHQMLQQQRQHQQAAQSSLPRAVLQLQASDFEFLCSAFAK